MKAGGLCGTERSAIAASERPFRRGSSVRVCRRRPAPPPTNRMSAAAQTRDTEGFILEGYPSAMRSRRSVGPFLSVQEESP